MKVRNKSNHVSRDVFILLQNKYQGVTADLLQLSALNFYYLNSLNSARTGSFLLVNIESTFSNFLLMEELSLTEPVHKRQVQASRSQGPPPSPNFIMYMRVFHFCNSFQDMFRIIFRSVKDASRKYYPNYLCFQTLSTHLNISCLQLVSFLQ